MGSGCGDRFADVEPLIVTAVRIESVGPARCYHTACCGAASPAPEAVSLGIPSPGTWRWNGCAVRSATMAWSG